MAHRPPSDAAVALRSLGRRYRGLFAGRGDDESPDDLAQRNGSEGRSALDHVVAATRTIMLSGEALQKVLTEDEAVLPTAVLDPLGGKREKSQGGRVDSTIAELAREAEALAARVQHVSAGDWPREGRVDGRGDAVSALSILWQAVDSAVASLKAAEGVLNEVRGRG